MTQPSTAELPHVMQLNMNHYESMVFAATILVAKGIVCGDIHGFDILALRTLMLSKPEEFIAFYERVGSLVEATWP